jgi:signal transduction histidine kinase
MNAGIKSSPAPGPGTARPRSEYSGLLPAALLGTWAHPSERPPRRSVRDWVVDLALFGFATSFGLPICAATSGRTLAGHTVVTLDVLAGLLCCLTLWWRRRWPIQIALLTAVAGTFSAFAIPAAAVALFTVAVHRRFAALAAVAGADLAASVLFTLIRPSPGVETHVPIGVGVLGIIAITTSGMFTRARRQLIVSLLGRAERAEAEQKLRITQARQLERTRIAREMHDVLAHRISLVSMHAGALEFRAEAVGPEVARSAAVIRTSAHQALEDLREVIDVLRTDTDDEVLDAPQPTLADIHKLVDEARAAGTRIDADLDLPPDAGEPPANIGRTAYRIVQEGLTNARKHATGAAVTVRVAGSAAGGLSVEVVSRRAIGTGGSSPIPGAGQGLIGLIERTELVGGTLEHGLTPAGDFRLAAWLPWM